MNKNTLDSLLSDGPWDAPFYKVLARNDTGEAPGHQGGVVIPKSLREFFPSLNESDASSTCPTIDRRITVELYNGVSYVATVSSRYQFQTWGGSRSAESRLTDNLGPIRSVACENDILIFQRSLHHLDLFRLVLVTKEAQVYQDLLQSFSNARWGPLSSASLPISQSEIIASNDEMLAEVSRPFVITRDFIPRLRSSRSSIARGTAFRETLITQYDSTCAVSGIALRSQHLIEVQAAHVVALSDGGADEPRNGLTLTGTLHWAFDRGLFVVDRSRRVEVPSSTLVQPGNIWLRQFMGIKIREARENYLRTAQEAFDYHRDKFLSA